MRGNNRHPMMHNCCPLPLPNSKVLILQLLRFLTGRLKSVLRVLSLVGFAGVQLPSCFSQMSLSWRRGHRTSIEGKGGGGRRPCRCRVAPLDRWKWSRLRSGHTPPPPGPLIVRRWQPLKPSQRMSRMKMSRRSRSRGRRRRRRPHNMQPCVNLSLRQPPLGRGCPDVQSQRRPRRKQVN